MIASLMTVLSVIIAVCGLFVGQLLMHIAREEMQVGQRYLRLFAGALFLGVSVILLIGIFTQIDNIPVFHWMTVAGIAVGFLVASLLQRVRAVSGIVGLALGAASSLALFPLIAGLSFLVLMSLPSVGFFTEATGRRANVHSASHGLAFLRPMMHGALLVFALAILVMMIPDDFGGLVVLQEAVAGACALWGFRLFGRAFSRAVKFEGVSSQKHSVQ